MPWVQESEDGVWDDMEGLKSGAEVMAVVEAKEATTLLLSPSAQRQMEVGSLPCVPTASHEQPSSRTAAL